MISKMKKYTFLVFHRDYDTFLTQLRDLGVVHITEKAAGLIENDEALQAALQHEDELRRLLAQGPINSFKSVRRWKNASRLHKKLRRRRRCGGISMPNGSHP